MTSCSDIPRHGTRAIEIKRGLAPKAEKGFHIARDDIRPDRVFLVYPGMNQYPKGNGIEAIGLRALAEELRNLG